MSRTLFKEKCENHEISEESACGIAEVCVEVVSNLLFSRSIQGTSSKRIR